MRSTEPGTPDGGGAVDVAQAVDEHEGAARAEIAQIDLGRAGADAAAVGRIAEIARIVEAAVERAAGARQALQRLGGRGEAGTIEIGAVDEDDGLVLIERVAADARAGDDDRLLALAGGRVASAERVLREGRRGESVATAIASAALPKRISTRDWS